MADVKLSQLAAVSPASVAAGAQLWTLPGFIQGLRLVRTAANALRVDPGAATVQSLNYPINVATAIAKTGLTLTANTWYHVYLYMNGATPDIEIVTTAPTAAYHGCARSKTGDTSRRYLGSVRTAAANTIVPFYHNPIDNSIKYLQDINTAPLSVLQGGVATTNTVVSCANAVPVTSRVMYAFAENGGTLTGAIAFISNPEAGAASSSTILEFLRLNAIMFGEMVLDSSQQFNYSRAVADSGGLAVWCTGYVFER